MKYVWHNSKSLDKAEIVIFGVTDESGSHAVRKGAYKGPDKIREVSWREAFFRKGVRSIAHPQDPIKKSIFDYGNVKRQVLSKRIYEVSLKNKLPVILGGDHSITFEALSGLNRLNRKFSVVYFDAHPDFICSSRRYYGSVICDALQLKNINFMNSLEIGLRAIEREEMLNLKRKKINVFHAVDVEKLGVKNLVSKIKKVVRSPVYLSIDMDVLDPAFAPGVNTPVPGGLTSNELIYLCKEVAKMGLIGFDVMETSPRYDFRDMTSHLASRLISEIISSLR